MCWCRVSVIVKCVKYVGKYAYEIGAAAISRCCRSFINEKG